MNRDSRGRFAKKSSDTDLIRKMDLDFKKLNPSETPVKKGSREIPVEDNRKRITLKSIEEPIYKFDNGRVYNIDKDLIDKAIKNINRLGLGTLEHPVKKDNLFDRFTCECSKENAKKTDSDLIKTLSDNITRGVIKEVEKKVESKPRKPLFTVFTDTRFVTLYGNKVGRELNVTIVKNLKDFVVSFNDSMMVSLNVSANYFPYIISFLDELKEYDYFTIVFDSYNDEGYQEHKVFDGFKLFDLTYVGEKDIYKITLSNI